MKTELDSLFALMNDSHENYDFIKSRISRLWPRWLKARQELLHNKEVVSERHAKSVSFS
jgi:hypothetical protein